ncbi:hypothetical protein ACFL14_01435 [Patescibacteria group bacterium]
MSAISKTTYWVTTIILVILLLAIGVGGWYYFGIGSPEDCKDARSTKCDDFEYQQYRYKLTEYGEIGDQDQYFSRIDKETERSETMADSINEAIPSLDGNLLMLFAQPHGSDLVILGSYLPDTDSPWSKLYLFDPSTKKFSEMDVNEIYTSRIAGFLKHVDETKLVYAPNEDENGDNKEMYLIDLVNDTYEKILTLKGNETFSAAESGMLGACFEMSWKDSDTIQYAVFNQSKKEDVESCPDDTSSISYFIEYRAIDI